MIMVNKRRGKYMDDMNELVLGDQANSMMIMLNTSFSYRVEDIVTSEFKSLYSRKKNWSEKYDMLLGLTSALSDHDVWMHDNEGGMDVVVKQLAKWWKSVLAKSDTELGIDSEYTRLGTVAMLEDFQNQIEECPEEFGLGSFKFEAASSY